MFTNKLLKSILPGTLLIISQLGLAASFRVVFGAILSASWLVINFPLAFVVTFILVILFGVLGIKSLQSLNKIWFTKE